MQVRDIGRQIYREKKVDIVSGEQWSDHIHIFVHGRSSATIFDLVCKLKCRSSH